MTPEEHAAAVMRAPGPITVASVAGAIRAYAEEVKGSQIADADELAKLLVERDAERTARKALQEHAKHSSKCDHDRIIYKWECRCGFKAALALAANLP